MTKREKSGFTHPNKYGIILRILNATIFTKRRCLHLQRIIRIYVTEMKSVMQGKCTFGCSTNFGFKYVVYEAMNTYITK